MYWQTAMVCLVVSWKKINLHLRKDFLSESAVCKPSTVVHHLYVISCGNCRLASNCKITASTYSLSLPELFRSVPRYHYGWTNLLGHFLRRARVARKIKGANRGAYEDQKCQTWTFDVSLLGLLHFEIALVCISTPQVQFLVIQWDDDNKVGLSKCLSGYDKFACRYGCGLSKS